MNFAYKLGKKPARHDPRTLMLAAYLRPALPLPPAAHDWTAGMPDDFGMLANDSVGDCAEAMAAHEIEIETSARDAGLLLFSPADVLGVYSAVTGYDPANPATDQGTSLLDLLNYERTTGFCGHKIWAYASLMSGGVSPPGDRIKLACWLFGPLSSGVVLRQCDLDSPASAVWDTAPGDADSEIVGGHAVPIVAYDGAGVTLITWGTRKRATWSWLFSRLDECYARLGGDWTRAGAVGTAIAPNGIAYDELTADLRAIEAP